MLCLCRLNTQHSLERGRLSEPETPARQTWSENQCLHPRDTPQVMHVDATNESESAQVSGGDYKAKSAGNKPIDQGDLWVQDPAGGYKMAAEQRVVAPGVAGGTSSGGRALAEKGQVFSGRLVDCFKTLQKFDARGLHKTCSYAGTRWYQVCILRHHWQIASSESSLSLLSVCLETNDCMSRVLRVSLVLDVPKAVDLLLSTQGAHVLLEAGGGRGGEEAASARGLQPGRHGGLAVVGSKASSGRNDEGVPA